MLLAPFFTAFRPFTNNYPIKLFLDAFSKNPNVIYSDLLYPICFFLVSQAFYDVIWRVSGVAEWLAEPQVRRKILLTSYDYIQYHSYTFFQNHLSGSITSKVKGILDGYDKFWAEMHHGLALKCFMALVGIVSLIFWNVAFGLFMVIWAVFFTFAMALMAKKSKRLSYEENESKHKVIGKLSDCFSNISSLFMFSSRKRELDLLDETISKDFVIKQMKVYKYDFFVYFIAGFLYLIMITIVLFYMISQFKKGKITVGDFAFVFGMVFNVSENIWDLVLEFQEFFKCLGDLKSSFTLLQIPHETSPIAQPLILKSPALEFSHVSFAYEGKDNILDDFSIKIKAGEKIGLVGYSGAGKSSVVNLLLKYFRPDKGSILIDGQDIETLNEDSLREQVAVIPQDTMLFHRTIFENISYGNPSASPEEIYDAAKKVYIHEAIMDLPQHYETLVGERGIKLSGGQRQRIAIARAILKKAPILILDEATSALDSKTEGDIQKSLEFLIKDPSRTVIAIAHRLSTIRHMDRIVVLYKGRIREEGTHEELTSSPHGFYQELWRVQTS